MILVGCRELKDINEKSVIPEPKLWLCMYDNNWMNRTIKDFSHLIEGYKVRYQIRKAKT